MKEVKAYVCSYCEGSLTTNYNSIVEHEKRCFKNPNRKVCACYNCIHSKRNSYDTTNRFGQPVTKWFSDCTIDCKFEDFYSYCEMYQEKKQ